MPTQKIFVVDIGSKVDSHPYEMEQIDSMDTARQVAGDIIEESQLVEEPLSLDQ